MTGPTGAPADGGAQTSTAGTGADAGVPPLIPSDIDLGRNDPDAVTPAPIRRLSNTELGNAFQILTGATSVAVATLPPESSTDGFDRVVQTQTVIDRTLDGLAAIAEEAVSALTEDRLATWSAPCSVTGTLGVDGAALAVARRPCAVGLATTWAVQAYRRPLTDAEQAVLLALYDGAGTYRDGINQLIRFVLQSPAFLYLIEQGTPVPGRSGLFALNDYEIATRLSLLICETLPDATLMQAAAAGALHQPDQITAQANRLFDLPCARTTVQRFYAEWLELTAVPGLNPDPMAFPAWNAQVRDAMVREDQTFLDQMTWAEGATLGDLFRADFTYADQGLGPIYGLPNLPTMPAKVALPDTRRGLLSHPSILALTSHATETSPILRGVYVLRNLLCLPIGSPPQNVNITLPPYDPTLTTRERYEMRTEQSFCATCHGEINPIGFGMENFDAIGRFRTTDNHLPVDSSGAVPAIGIGDFDGAAALGEAIADRPELELCFARKWLRFGLGRLESQLDETSLLGLVDLLRNGGTLRQAMVGLTGTYAFSHRAPGQ
jgi:hypothetical protein